MSTRKTVLIVHKDALTENALEWLRSNSECGLMTPVEVRTDYFACVGIPLPKVKKLMERRGLKYLPVRRKESDADTDAYIARSRPAIRAQLRKMKRGDELGLAMTERDFSKFRRQPEFDSDVPLSK
jgi:hypothetical protein